MAMLTLSGYIKKIVKALKHEDADQLRDCLTINPANNAGEARADFAEPNDFDLYPVPEKFRPVVKCHLKVMTSIYKYKSIDTAFTELNEMNSNLIRAAESQTNWINLPLMSSLSELIAVYKVRQQKYPEDVSSYQFQDMEIDSFEGGSGNGPKTSALEQLSITVNKGFKLSLNDKNLVLSQSKRNDIYFFLSNLIKIYFKMNKLELAKSVEKAVKGTRFELPPMNAKLANKKHLVVYLYYSSLLSLDDGDFTAAESKLDKAMDLMRYYSQKCARQTNQILLILLPLKLHNKNQVINSPEFWKEHPELQLVYRDNLLYSVIHGDIAKFEDCIKKYEVVFLKNHLYLLVLSLKQQCYLRLVKKTATIYRELCTDPLQAHIVPFSAFQVAFEFSKYGTSEKEQDVDDRVFGYAQEEIECILAGLIAKGKIKGYLSNINCCAVLSKTVAFPK